MDTYGCEIAMSNKFPGKLWRMVNSSQSEAITWGQGGQTIIIHQAKFQEEYLDPPNGIFKTTNIGSFIRQLNLYGFRKLNIVRYAETGAELREVHEFQNDYFLRGHPELLSRLRRNVGIRRSREMAVKRQLDEIHNYSDKKQRLIEMQGTQYLSVPQTHFNKGQDCVVTTNGHTAFQTSTQTGQWPVYMQWDGQSFKYVILPDSGHKKHAPLHQHNLKSHKSYDGETFKVLHIPDNGVGEMIDEYYLLSLDEDVIEQSPQVPCTTAQQINTASNAMTTTPVNYEYSQSEFYQLAELLASDPQCAIAAAQQLLAQATQEQASTAVISEKGDGYDPCVSYPTTTSSWTQCPSYMCADNATPSIKQEEESVGPKVIVTTNEEAMKPVILKSLLRNSTDKEEANLSPCFTSRD